MRDLLPQSVDVTWGVLLAVPLFLILFFTIVFWVFSKKRKEIYKEVEKMPLED